MVSYSVMSLLLLPLVLSIMELIKRFPSGGFYVYGLKALNPFAGFISAWSYFIGKLASSILVIHTFVLLSQGIIPGLNGYNPLLLDVILLALVISLNMLNMKTGSAIQGWLMGVKLFPIFFLLLTGTFLIRGENFSAIHQVWSGIPRSLPLVMHAMVGFEAACSISSNIKDAKKNAPRAIMISYGIVTLIYFLYQLIFYGMLGSDLAAQTDYRDAFPLLLQKLMPNNFKMQIFFQNILHFAIASSALSGGFGIIYTNMWNLYSLAQHHHTFFPRLLTRLNRYHIPYICVLIEGIVCLIYLFVSRGYQLPLQQITALGCTIAYTISVLSLLAIRIKNGNRLWLPLLGLINCTILIFAAGYNLWFEGAQSLSAFIIVLGLGVLMFWIATPPTNFKESLT